MFERFDARRPDPVFERKRGLSLLLASLAYALAGAYGVLTSPEEEVAVELEPEVKDFAVEEEVEEEEIEEEEAPPPPPEPPPPQPRPKQKPKPQPKLVPDEVPDAPLPELDQVNPDKLFGTGEGGVGSGQRQPEKKPEKKPEKQVEKKPEKKPEKKIDPTKPVKRPEGATVPKPSDSNKPPDYPKELRNEGIEGEVVIKLHVHRDGKVKGGKILRVTATATGEAAQEKAKNLFKKAVIAAVRSWTYTPSKLKGEPISVWIIVNIPFKLKAG
ncbi:MAG: energy transducer TonB [Nannocystaceae bacterium]